MSLDALRAARERRIAPPAPRRPTAAPEPADDARPVLLDVRSTDRLGDSLFRVRRDPMPRSPARFWLEGELCAYSAPRLITVLEGLAPDRDVVLDTWALSFVDSSGVAAWLDLGRRWRARGRCLQIANPSAAVCQVVGVLHLEEELFAPSPPGHHPPVGHG